MMPRKVTLQSSHLRLGMFVADLDRSWEGTPFLMQGVLVTDPRQINYLRQACREVVVDMDRSSSDSVEHLAVPAAEGRVAGSGKRSARERFGEWLRSWWPQDLDGPVAGGDGELPDDPRLADMPLGVEHRILFGAVRARRRNFAQWLIETWRDAVAAILQRLRGDARRRTARVEGMPADFQLVTYSDTKSFDEALGPARQAYQSIESTMKTVIGDLAENREIAVDTLGTAVSELVESVAANPEAMMWLARMREQNERTYKHSVEVAVYMVTFGRHLGFPAAELRNLGMIGLLLDIGMTRIDNALLDKKGALSDDERAELCRHVDYSLEMLDNVPDLAIDVRVAIAQHHERGDGSGYPLGLKGEATSFFGRMVVIAETFATLTSNRHSAVSLSAFKSMKVLYEGAGTIFHEPLVEQFVQAIGLFPVGSLVELSSGEVAAVVSHNKVRRLKPRVLVLTDPDKRRVEKPFERNLLVDSDDDDVEPLRIWRGLPAGAYGVDGRDYFLK